MSSLECYNSVAGRGQAEDKWITVKWQCLFFWLNLVPSINWCLHNLKKSTWTCSSEKKHLLDKHTVFGGFKRQIPVPPPNHRLWNRAHYDYRKMRRDQPMPKWMVNLKRDFQELDHETNNKVHRGVLLYEMLFATTPFTGRCNFSGWWIFGGKATGQSFLEGSDPLFVCKGSCLIRYPKWQWTSWKLEDNPSFATFPKHHQKEQFSGGQVGFPALWMLVNHPQLHSPVGRSSSSTLLTMLLAVIFAQQMKSAVG